MDDRKYFWTIDGTPAEGSLSDYVSSLEHAHYSGVPVLQYVYTLEVWGGSGLELRSRKVEHENHDHGESDYASFTVRVGDDEAHGSIDLRA